MVKKVSYVILKPIDKLCIFQLNTQAQYKAKVGVFVTEYFKTIILLSANYVGWFTQKIKTDCGLFSLTNIHISIGNVQRL